MKKISVLLLTVLAIAQLTLFANAYTFNGSDLYTIDIPDSFTQVSSAQFSAKDGSTLDINISSNTEEYCIENMSNKKIRENAEKEANAAKEAFKMSDKKGEMEVVSAEKIKHPSGKTAYVTVFRTTIEEDGKPLSHLQKSYTFAGKEKIYSFIYTPANEDDINSLQETFDSIDISESEIKSTLDKVKDAGILAGFFLLILLGIIRFLRTPGKRKAGKL